MRAYTEEADFINDSLVIVARLLFDRAVVTISECNIDDGVESALFELLEIAKEQNVEKPTVESIAFYLNTVADENRQMRIDFGWD